MKEQKFMVYEAPQVELVEVEVEQGFAGSETKGYLNQWNIDNGSWS